MPPGLLIAIRRTAPFKEVLDETRRVLATLTKSDPIPPFKLEVPPATKFKSPLESAFVGDSLGAYLTLQGVARSMVEFHVFTSRPGLMVGCSSAGRTFVADVMVAAMSIATARILDGTIIDAYDWIDQEEATADELVKALELPEEQRGLDFLTAADLVSKRQAVPPSYGRMADPSD